MILPLLVVRHCSKLSSYAISWKTNKPNFRKWWKTWSQDWFWSKFGPKFFFISLLPLDVRHSCKLWLYAISRKTNESNLENGGFYLYQMLDVAAIYHCIQVQEKLMIETQNYGKKPHFAYDLGLLGSNSGCQIVWVFFFKNLASSVTKYHGHLSSCTISEKLNDSILRKLSDGRTDGWTNQQTNRQEWFHRALFY